MPIPCSLVVKSVRPPLEESFLGVPRLTLRLASVVLNPFRQARSAAAHGSGLMWVATRSSSRTLDSSLPVSRRTAKDSPRFLNEGEISAS
jgi:hypothetical protein